RRFRTLGGRDDRAHLLRLLDNREQIVDIEVADRAEELEAEATPDHGCRRQRAALVLVEAREPTADDEAHVLGDVDLLEREVGANVPGGVEDASVLDEVLVDLLDEERVALGVLED